MGLVGDAKETVKKLNAKLNNSVSLEQLESVKNAVIEIKRKIGTNLTKSEKRHKKLLTILRAIAPLETIFAISSKLNLSPPVILYAFLGILLEFHASNTEFTTSST